VIFGLRRILLEGAEVYRLQARNPETLAKFGHGCPDDWLERTLYQRSYLGVWSMLAIDIFLFGAPGITMFAFQMLAMPVCAAGGINGLGHALGYRNFETNDASTNMLPVGLLIGGEELHNNHHAFPTSAKFSVRPWEFDIGWLYICVLRVLGLCRLNRAVPAPPALVAPRPVDTETLRAVLTHRMHILRDYSRRVTLPVLRMERRARPGDAVMQKAWGLLVRWPGHFDDVARGHLARVLESSPHLRTVHEYRRQLMELWQQANVSNERLVRELREWCACAEASGIAALQEFSARIRGYVAQPVPA
jgi:stearoyl-CoA desaturase (delta-9 desaturase)